MHSAARLDVLFVTRRTSGVGRRMESVVAALQARRRDLVGVRTVDADSEHELVETLGVHDVPTIVLVEDQRPVAQVVGRASLHELEELVDRHLSERQDLAS